MIKDTFFFLGLCLLFLLLLYNQLDMERKFAEHWHYVPKEYSIELTTRKLSDNPGYHLTKPKPKYTESTGYVYWTYCWR